MRTGFQGLTLLDAGGTGNLGGCDSNMFMQCLFNKAICFLDSPGVHCADTDWDDLKENLREVMIWVYHGLPMLQVWVCLTFKHTSTILLITF